MEGTQVRRDAGGNAGQTGLAPTLNNPNWFRHRAADHKLQPRIDIINEACAHLAQALDQQLGQTPAGQVALGDLQRLAAYAYSAIECGGV